MPFSIIEESVQKYKSIKKSFKAMNFKEKKSVTNIPQAEGMNRDFPVHVLFNVSSSGSKWLR